MNKISFAFFLVVLVLACENPFTTRKPEAPDAQNPSSFKSPTSPEIVFDNLRSAIRELNVENYIRSFVDPTRSEQPFTFVPDQGVAATNPGTFDNWSLEDERSYLVKALKDTPKDSTHILVFTQESQNVASETATFTQNYALIIKHLRAAENIPTEFRGQSKFWLQRDDTGDWAIYRWEDYTNGVDPSWSELKAAF